MACFLVSSAAKPAMNCTEVVVHKSKCAHHLATQYIETMHYCCFLAQSFWLRHILHSAVLWTPIFKMLGRLTEASSAGKSAEDAVPTEASSAAMNNAAESSAAAAECVGSPTLREMSSRLSSLPSQASAQQLLEDIPILEEWQRAPHPSHKVRDAMAKLGQHWNVHVKTKGKKRPAADVAKDLEERMLERGKELLAGSVAQPATQTSSSPADEASAPKKPKTAAAAVRPASLQDIFARQKRAIAPPTVAESADGEPPASQGISKQPRLEHSSSSSAANAEPQPKPARALRWPNT